MTPSTDAYWDDLGVAWRAIDPDPNIIAPRLKRRLRWQTRFINAGVVAGIPFCILGFSLGGLTIWGGWSAGAWNFVTRGIAIVAISAMIAWATWLQRAAAADETKTLAAMIDLAMARAEKAIKAIQLLYYSCAVAAAFGLLGYGIRTYLDRPPAMSPAEPLALLGLFGLILYLWRRRIAGNLLRLRCLKSALMLEDA